MSVYVEINGDGPDIVLLHGWAMHGGVFAEVASLLAKSYRVHNIDLPGHGRSDADKSIASLDQLTERIRPYVPQNAVVLGWSLGGQIALQLATCMSLRALVLVSATPKFVADASWPKGMAPNVFAQFFARLHENIDTTVQDFLSLQVRGDVHAMQTLKSLRNSLIQHPPDAQMLEAALTMLRDMDLRPLLSRIQVPTLLIAGEHDRIAHPAATQSTHSLMHNSQYIEIKRAGHACFLSHRDEFMTALNQFIAQLPLSGAT
ncbi:MAG TPA: pimeloyl-ACP methyl ester esterase BioH [Steroidobacteraceae bacterium]|jgi:pimeloyl-[acyl-carrier protein] methyl ester esterase|nr:pimeloyl-ACP methyl ester esterase BioH [Steroidobacteraceae bacterium]